MLELRGITKRFPGVVANDDVHLKVEPGTIVGLLGENGAGKSTLMNILYGLLQADEGDILIDGEPLTLGSSAAAIAAGIGMVHQHFMLVPVFSVAENVVLGVEPTTRGGRLAIEQANRQVSEISEQYGLAVDPTAIIEDLPVGIQQRVEIIKVLFRDAKYLIFDEPTAVLTPQEVTEFFGILNGLKNDGKGIIFITHKLREVLEVCDDIVVLRRGKTVGQLDPKTATEAELAETMVGRAVDMQVHKAPASPGEVALGIRGLSVADDRGRIAVEDLDLDVRRGEIVGIAGVQGNGQTELVEAVTGLRRPESGTIELTGEVITNASPRVHHAAGMAHVPEDRQHAGLVLDFDLIENSVLDRYYEDDFSAGMRMDWDAAERHAEEIIEAYDVRTPSARSTADSLSGGNQQKLIVAREFARDIDLAVASQPTRGVDVGSIEFIHSQIVEQRDDGAGILLVSTELDEIMALADRIVVMFDGRIVLETTPAQTSHGELGLAMAGALDQAEETVS